MSTRAKRPCSKPGCPALATIGRHCAAHQPTVKREDRRETAHQRGYGATWRRLRLIILARDPICTDPFGIHAKQHEIVPSVDVDHIVPKSQGGLDRNDNLRGLCHSCHSKITASSL
jgi:5-methylcytosine-specific restriction protein A